MTVTVRPLHSGVRWNEINFPPFSEAASRDTYFPTDTHEEALSRLLYLTESHERCGVLTGDSGSGKTTVFFRLETLLRRSGMKVQRIDLAGASESTLLHRLAIAVGLNPSDGLSAESMINDLELVFTAAGRVQHPWVLLLDHADRLRPGALAAVEQVLHLAANAGAVLLFATRPEGRSSLLKILGGHSGLRIELTPLESAEMGAYLDDSLERGMVSTIQFSRDAVQLMARISQGNMRQINRLSRAACLAAAADHRSEIDSELLLTVSRELT